MRSLEEAKREKKIANANRLQLNQQRKLLKSGLVIGKCSDCGSPWGRVRPTYRLVNSAGGVFCDNCWQKIAPIADGMMVIKITADYCKQVIARSDGR